MPELREVFEMTTKQMGEPNLDSWREQERRQRSSTRNKKIGALAVAAALVVAAVALMLGALTKQDPTTPAIEQPTVAPATPSAEEVATGFVEAYGAFDADGAIAYLSDDVDLSGMALAGTQDLRMLFSLLDAQGYKQLHTSCAETGSSTSGTYVQCTFDYYGFRSDEIGRGPYTGSSFDLTVRDGEIVRASLYWETEKFSPQMWEPFAEWVSTNYPEDGAVMYNSDYTDWQLTKESIRLWEQHTQEYVKEVESRTAGR